MYKGAPFVVGRIIEEPIFSPIKIDIENESKPVLIKRKDIAKIIYAIEPKVLPLDEIEFANEQKKASDFHTGKQLSLSWGEPWMSISYSFPVLFPKWKIEFEASRSHNHILKPSLNQPGNAAFANWKSPKTSIILNYREPVAYFEEGNRYQTRKNAVVVSNQQNFQFSEIQESQRSLNNEFYKLNYAFIAKLKIPLNAGSRTTLIYLSPGFGFGQVEYFHSHYDVKFNREVQNDMDLYDVNHVFTLQGDAGQITSADLRITQELNHRVGFEARFGINNVFYRQRSNTFSVQQENEGSNYYKLPTSVFARQTIYNYLLSLIIKL